jgi:nitroimidazol reductase NimA-like FMN-containing flavoprotein (pyridoxamine 5'-phosphate oxidase superfamily)
MTQHIGLHTPRSRRWSALSRLRHQARGSKTPFPAVLPLRECWDRVASVQVGRLDYTDIDGPIILPMNHVLDHDTIVVRTSPSGRLALMADGARVAYEVDDATPEGGGSWSVLVSGRADFMTPDEIAALATRPEPFAPGDRSLYVRITPRAITGHRVRP